MIVVICVVAVVVLAITGIAWGRHEYNNPQRAFWGMLNNSLSMSSVTRQVTETDQANGQQQISRLYLGGQTLAQAHTTIQQLTQSGLNTVKTETLGTLSNDYARYLSIDTKQLNKSNQPLNFSGILGIWGKSDTSPSSTQPNARFLNGTILSVIPFAPLSRAERSQVLQTMRDKNVYEVNYGKVTSRKVNGRTAFIYPVSVKASAYVSMLKVFAHQLGLKQLEAVDPAAYAQSAPEQLEISVDKLSHQLLSINYDGIRQETYSGYGLQADVAAPAATIPLNDLQQRLQTVQ